MKRTTNLYRRIWHWEHLLLAWRKARKGKRGRASAAAFEVDAAGNLLDLRRELGRLISAAPFRDRVVHHALCSVTEPLFECRFIRDSYANRRGKGTHAALDRCQHFARRHRFVLQCDVEQFFPAVDHQILGGLLERVVADADTLWLCRQILDSGLGVLDSEYSMKYFPGDDLLAAVRPRGLPIGNLTSQFWSNVYLDPLDQFIKRRLSCRAYLRFVDDFLLFADDKVTLWQWRKAIIRFLETLRLRLHERSCQPRSVSEGIPFLGFVVFPHHKRLKRRKGISYRRRLKKLIAEYRAGELSRDELMASVKGWVAHASYGQTHGLRRRLFREHPPVMSTGGKRG